MMKSVIYMIFFSCSMIPVCNAQQLSLFGKSVIQGSTIGSHEAYLAIDGDPTTFALSSSPHVPDNMAWWLLDLGAIYYIQSVSVTNGNNFETNNSYNLENFDIYVVTDNYLYLLCQRYTIPPFSSGETKTFPCNNGTIVGSSIYLKKLAGGIRNEMAIAELALFISGNATKLLPIPASIIQTPPDQVLFGKNATQAATVANHEANSAIDGDPTSYSQSSSPQAPGDMAWWMVDLGGSFPILSISITNPYNTDNNYHLENFAIYVINDMGGFSAYFLCRLYSLPLFNSGEKKNFLCEKGVINGRWIYIQKVAGGTSNDLAFAEVDAVLYNSLSPNSSYNNSTINNANIQPIDGIAANQSTDVAPYYANLALDGEFDTYAMAVKNIMNPFAWWQGDLGAPYYVTEVVVTSGQDYTTAQYIQSISIDLSFLSYNDDPHFANSVKCYSRSSQEAVPPFSTFSFKCNSPILGRYLVIRRIDDGTYRPDIIALAEVQVFGYKS